MTRFVTILFACLVAAGCDIGPRSDYGKLGLISAHGLITLDGEPIEGAVVTFNDLTNGTFSYGLTDSSGHYRLQLDSEHDGVTPGEKTVEVSTTRKILGLNSEEDAGESSVEKPQKKSEKTKDMIPECYNKLSGLKINVSSSQTAYDFDLKSDCSTKASK